MPLPPVPLALAALAACMLISGIVLITIAPNAANSVALDVEGILLATRSRYILGQVSGSSACGIGVNGCDGSCEPIDLASSVPTYAYFHFYNITNPAAVTGGGAAALAEVGPYTCVTAPPVMTARITRTSATLSSDSSAVSMTYEQTLDCDAVRGGGDDIVYLFDRSADTVTGQAVSTWISTLKTEILSSDDTVGTGGARAFESYEAHGNASIPNNYMRRMVDDAPVLPVFPHGFVSDGGTRVESSITETTTLQWHIASIGQSVAFTWKYGLYVTDPIFDEYMYARFVTYVLEVDLSSRASALFDKAYSYHLCTASDSTSSVELATLASSYPACADTDGKMLSPDDFFLDVNLLMGIPAPIIDNSGGNWQAYEVPEFHELAASDPNCTGTYIDPNVAGNLYAWGFWGGVLPYVSQSSELGYDPLSPGPGGKYLAEFGVTRNGGTLPAFAFSMMPKMITLIAPQGLGSSYPFSVLGKFTDIRLLVEDMTGVDCTLDAVSFYLYGQGANFYIRNYPTAMETLHFYPGLYCLLYAFVIVLPVAAFRFKVDSALLRD